jgi:hypothetical protein
MRKRMLAAAEHCGMEYCTTVVMQCIMEQENQRVQAAWANLEPRDSVRNKAIEYGFATRCKSADLTCAAFDVAVRPT